MEINGIMNPRVKTKRGVDGLTKRFIDDELAYFFAANPGARKASETELMELWRRWIAERVPNLALAHMTFDQVVRYRDSEPVPMN